MGLVLAVTVLVLAGTAWFLSDADLRAVDRRAAAMGIPTSWSSLSLVRSDLNRLTTWQRFQTLALAVRSYSAIDDQGRMPQLGEPLPEGLRAHHASLPTGDVTELLSLCDQLAGSDLVLRTSWDWTTSMTEIDATRAACKLFAERIALAEPEAVATEAQRLISIATMQCPNGVLGGLVAISELAIWQRAVACRLPEPEIDCPAIAAQAQQGRTWLSVAMPRAYLGEFVFMRTLLHEAVRGPSPLGEAIATEMGIPTWLCETGLHRLVLRQGRGDALMAALDLMPVLRLPADHAHRLAFLHTTSLALADRSRWIPAVALEQFLLTTHELIARSWAKVDTGLAVIAAEALGSAWPADPMDAASHPVRRIERNGRLIGYYLVGPNGRDDGGRTSHPRDDCVALYERLGSPHAADPLPLPPQATPAVLPSKP